MRRQGPRVREASEDALARLEGGDRGVLEHVAHCTEEFAAIYDGYPKSQVHLLAVPRLRLDGPQDLTAEHLPLLRRLAEYVAWLLRELSAQRPELTWRQGVHAMPSLRQLHVHVISQDFRSPRLKNKKHYNSFQPPFLVPLQDLVSALEGGSLLPLGLGPQAEAHLKRGLTCAGCGAAFGNRFAELKRHIDSCVPPPSAAPPVAWEQGGPDEHRAEHEAERRGTGRKRPLDPVVDLTD
mmetsp:Transcript_127216/g.341382  ORF Transcript_127216/g.341382 Transcript_127216/m.341382 type:complete len:238 (+) Transcript_127216:128-841(+)